MSSFVILEIVNWVGDCLTIKLLEFSKIMKMKSIFRNFFSSIMGVAVSDSASKISKIIDMSQIPIGVFEYDESKNRVFCSSKLIHILGWDESKYADSYYDKDAFSENLANLEKYWYQSTEDTTTYKIPNKYENKWIQVTLLKGEHETLGTVIDISREMEEKIKIKFERDYDFLTGILNRRAFDTALDNLFAFPDRIGNGAFLMFDLDNLKYINDTYGHQVGDAYIKLMANVLKDFEKYNGIVSRRSGDEFNVFLYGYHSKEELREIIFSVYKKIEEQTIKLPDEKIYTLAASAGVAYYPYDADNIKNLTMYSDFAMYLVKHSLKGNIKEFDVVDYNNRSDFISGHKALVRLLDRGELCYAMQPIFDVKKGNVFGYEMLMWSNIKELSSPMEILSLAKSQSKLYELEKTTLFNALNTFAEKVKAGIIEKECKVFINSFGSVNWKDDDLLILSAKYKDYLSSIVIELIESEQHVVEYSEAKSKIVKEFGGLIALDNFDSGYNNETLLINSSPDLIKLNKNLVHEIDEDRDKQKRLKEIISYAKSRKIKIVTEGIETQKEMETVISFGADYLQGYYIGRPEINIVPIEEIVVREIKTIRDKISVS